MIMLRRMIRIHLPAALASLLCLTLPAASWANFSNTATASFNDAAGVAYNITSNTVNTVTPPVISGADTATGNIGVVFTPYTITASNTPTSYGATGLPAGLTLNPTTGVISGTPTVEGPFEVTLTATNAAGTSAPFKLMITIRGAPALTLTKSASSPTATSGATLTYTIQYQNNGTGNATAFVIQDVIPAGTTLVPGSITGGGTVSGETITWNIGAVNAGAAAQSVTFQVKVN